MMRMRIFILFAAAHIFAAAPFSAGALTTETATAAEHQGPNIIAEGMMCFYIHLRNDSTYI